MNLTTHNADVAGTTDQTHDGPDGPDGPVWARSLRPVLAPLAAAGAGPVMPLSLLTAVAGEFGGPTDTAGVDAVLRRLDRLVVRVHPGTDHELVGLFHPTLTSYLTPPTGIPTPTTAKSPRRYSVDVTNARRLLVDKAEELEPVTGLYRDNPLSRWATDALPEHLWQLGDLPRALKLIRARPLPTPRQNLDRWHKWLPRTTHIHGPRHPRTLQCRHSEAFWTGRAGEGAEALRLFQELLPDQIAVLGPRHPNTLTTRNNIASWTGQRGDSAEALRLFQELLPDLTAALGADQPATKQVRSRITELDNPRNANAE